MSTHTPGPWHTEPEEWTEGRGIAICDSDGIVAIVDPECEDLAACDEAHVNARLIAAAPDLLAALKRARNITQWVEDTLGKRHFDPDTLQQMDAAIALAEEGS